VVPNPGGNFPLGGNFGLPGGNSGRAGNINIAVNIALTIVSNAPPGCENEAKIKWPAPNAK